MVLYFKIKLRDRQGVFFYHDIGRFVRPDGHLVRGKIGNRIFSLRAATSLSFPCILSLSLLASSITALAASGPSLARTMPIFLERSFLLALKFSTSNSAALYSFSSSSTLSASCVKLGFLEASFFLVPSVSAFNVYHNLLSPNR